MNNLPPFLDSPGNSMGSNIPRQQTPLGQPTAHQQNGSTGMPMVNGLPSGGTQTDMTHLWSVVQQLSELLAENRAQTQGLVNGVQQIHARALQEGTSPTVAQVNGELNASRHNELLAVQAQNSNLQRRLAELEQQNEAYSETNQEYERAITHVLDKLRPFAYNHAQAIISIHAHYNNLLERERQEKMEQNLEHAKWQAGLQNVARYARMALTAQNDEGLPHLSKIRELKNENKVLRKLAGWEPVEDSSEDESDGERKIEHEHMT